MFDGGDVITITNETTKCESKARAHAVWYSKYGNVFFAHMVGETILGHRNGIYVGFSVSGELIELSSSCPFTGTLMYANLEQLEEHQKTNLKKFIDYVMSTEEFLRVKSMEVSRVVIQKK